MMPSVILYPTHGSSLCVSVKHKLPNFSYKTVVSSRNSMFKKNAFKSGCFASKKEPHMTVLTLII